MSAIGKLLKFMMGSELNTTSIDDEILPVADGTIAVAPTQTAITPSNTDSTTAVTAKGLSITVGGTLVTRGVGQAGSITQTVTAGQYLPWRVERVLIGTDATVVGLS